MIAVSVQMVIPLQGLAETPWAKSNHLPGIPDREVFASIAKGLEVCDRQHGGILGCQPLDLCQGEQLCSYWSAHALAAINSWVKSGSI